MPGTLRTFALQGTTGTSRIPGWVYEGDGSFAFSVVGESHCQKELWSIVGLSRQGEDGIEVELDALLLPEPDNKFDANAMRVFVAGQRVGYLSRDDAAQLVEEMATTEGQPLAVACRARITGGFTTRSGSIAHLGVVLDLDYPLD